MYRSTGARVTIFVGRIEYEDAVELTTQFSTLSLTSQPSSITALFVPAYYRNCIINLYLPNSATVDPHTICHKSLWGRAMAVSATLPMKL
jgi:hypothetical protein